MDDINKELDKLEKLLNEAIKERRKNEQNRKKIRNDLHEEICEGLTTDLKKIFDRSIYLFYKSYSPLYYERQFGLYTMYNISYDKKDVYIEMGHELAEDLWKKVIAPDTQHRIGAEYVYDKIFKEGWHGGATPSDKRDYFKRPYPNGYEMAYRTPFTEIPRKKKDGTPGKPIPRFSLWSYRPVEQEDVSPYDLIKQQKSNYLSGKNNFSKQTAENRITEAIFKINEKYNDVFNLKNKAR